MSTTLYDRSAGPAINLIPNPARTPGEFAPAEERGQGALYNGDAAVTPAPADARALHGYSTIATAIERRGPELWEKTGATETALRQTVDTFAGIARTTGLPDKVVADLAESHINHRLAEAQPAGDVNAADEALDQQIAAWNIETRADLATLYGGAEAEALLKRADRWVKSQPALAKLFREQRGLGSRPDVVKELVSFVFSNGLGR